MDADPVDTEPTHRKARHDVGRERCVREEETGL